VTEPAAQDAADRLKKQGAKEFIERVRRSAQSVYDMVPSADPNDTTLRAYALEVLRLNDID